MRKKEKQRIIKNLYFLADTKKLFRYPLNEQDLKILNTDEETITSLIREGLLVITGKTVHNVELCTLRVSPDGMQYVSNATLLAKEYADNIKRNREYDRVRALHNEHYKHERNNDFFAGSSLTNNGGKVMCTECFAINRPCEHDGEFLIDLPPEARPPRKNASKTRWRSFIERFVPADKRP